MINFYLCDFVMGRNLLGQAIRDTEANAIADKNGKIPDAKLSELAMGIHECITHCVDGLGLQEAKISSDKLFSLISSYKVESVRWGKLHDSLVRMKEEIDIGIDAECFFHYSRNAAKRIVSIDKDWKNEIIAFPSIKPEVLAGIDCYAFGNYVGCVFHMSRIAEFGLRSIGRERGVTHLKKKKGKPTPIEWATWGEVFSAIEPTIENIRATWPKGKMKDLALSFYNSILSDLRHIQDFRDKTMHFRASYDFGQAESAIFRVKSLMSTLATKIDENTSRAIPQSAWK